MKEIFIRALSGSVYAIAIIGSLLYNQIAFYLILLLFVGLTVFEFQKLINHKALVPYIFLIIIWGVFIQSNFIYNDYLKFILFPTLFFHILLIVWLYNQFNLINKNYAKNLLSIFYITLSGFFIIALTQSNDEYDPYILIFLYLLTWVNNTFAYLFGVLFGKNLLFKSISPKKSWEGLLGGILCCLFSSYLFIYFEYPIEKKLIIILTIIIPLLNLYGDLIQSKFKRLAKVKNSGSIIPGHGGFYDRMDSILLTAPWVYLVILIKNHVS
ncbi:MAG: phosphatidate cytidylyltransferase [Bacteroidota bacterium]|nr:phosphatidate cytidylyltransferase [Bacteroidota bacterium]